MWQVVFFPPQKNKKKIDVCRTRCTCIFVFVFIRRIGGKRRVKIPPVHIVPSNMTSRAGQGKGGIFAQSCALVVVQYPVQARHAEGADVRLYLLWTNASDGGSEILRRQYLCVVVAESRKPGFAHLIPHLDDEIRNDVSKSRIAALCTYHAASIRVRSGSTSLSASRPPTSRRRQIDEDQPPQRPKGDKAAPP